MPRITWWLGKRSGYASAEVVARTPHQRRDLADMLVLPDQEQTEVWIGIQGQLKRWMRAGYADNFGAVLFVDETTRQLRSAGNSASTRRSSPMAGSQAAAFLVISAKPSRVTLQYKGRGPGQLAFVRDRVPPSRPRWTSRRCPAQWQINTLRPEPPPQECMDALDPHEWRLPLLPPAPPYWGAVSMP